MRLLTLIILAAALVGGLVWWLAKPGLVCVAFNEGHSHHLGPLLDSTTVGQTFFCTQPELARIEVRLGTFGSFSSSPIGLHLAADEPGETGPPVLLGPGHGEPLALWPGLIVSQTLFCRRDGLKGLKILIVRQPGAKRGVIEVSLAEAQRPHLRLCSNRRPVGGLPVHGFADFSFPPLEDSAEKEYRLTIRLIGVGPHAGVELRTTDGWSEVDRPPPEDWPRLQIDGEWRPGRIILRPEYPPALASEPLAARQECNSFFVSDNAFFPFAFPPQPGSAGRWYYFYLAAPQASPSDALTVWVGDAAGSQGSLVIDGLPVEADLNFRAYCAVDKGEAAGLFARRAAEGRSAGLGQTWLIILAVVAQLVAGAGLLWWWFRPADSGGR